MICNKTLITWFKSNYKKVLRKQYEDVKAQLNTLNELRNVLDGQLEAIEKVSEVYKGVALSYFGENIEAVDTNITTRAGIIYQNAVDETKWGAHVYEDSFGCKGNKWIGAGWTSRDELETVVKDWIVEGTLPAEKDRKYAW